MKTTTILTATLGLALGSLHAQTVPLFINYQGKVTDSGGIGLGTGTPVNRKVIFRIFDAATAGTRLWSEQHTVTISNGEFSVLLGNGINANYAGADEVPLKTTTPLDTVFTSSGILRYVEIVVDNGDNTLNVADAPIAPRQQITSTAYSFHARSADTIASGTDLQLNGSANYGLGYYGSTRLFNGTAVDGPVLFGQAGGALGSVNGGTKNIALRWNAAGAIGIGSADLSGAAATTKLVLQGDDSNTVPLQLNIRGNSDTNKRLLLGYNTTSNYGSLQAYSGVSTATNLLLNPGGGNVGIGMTSPPSQKLDVEGNVQVSGNVLLPNASGTAGVIQLGSARIHSYGNANFFAGSFSGNFTMTGTTNVGIGVQTLINNTTGVGNTAIGNSVLETNSGGSNNAGIGYGALEGNTTGSNNNALGYFAGYALTTGSNNIAIGHYGVAGASGTIWLGSEGTHTKTILAGNVGIGTNSPLARLDLAGAGSAFPATTGTIPSAGLVARIKDSTSASLDIGGNGSNGYWLQCTHTSALNQTYPLMLNPNGGNVGIGTTSATKGKVHINGGGGANPYSGTIGYLTSTGAASSNLGTGNSSPSLYATGEIWALAFFAQSDERIKSVAGRSDGASDLATLLGIEVTDYTYIDKVAKGTGKYKKVIAQQVEEVYPQAVRRSTDEVPDIYKKAKIQDGWVMLATDLKKGERVRLIGEKHEGIHEVLEVEKGKFRTDFVSEGDEVFVYGRQVKDFRSVDYEAISMLNVSATQQIKKEKDAEVKALQEENSALRTRVAALEAKDTVRDAKMASIEKLLESTTPPATRTVSLNGK